MTDACCKIGRTEEAYGLQSPDDGFADIDGYLVARWRGDDDYDATGIRPLVAWFNKHLLRQVYIEHGRRVTSTRIDSEYDALTSDAEAERLEVLDDLAQDGVDGEALVDSFATRSTMARHLKQCLGAEKDTGSGRGDWERDSIAYSRENTREHIASVLSTLANKGRLPGADEADLSLPIYLTCPECSTRAELETALDRGYICADHLGVAEGEQATQ